MVLLSCAVLSFLIALLRGGRVSALAGLRFNGLYFLAGAMFTRLVLVLTPLQPRLLDPAIGDLRYGGLLYSLSLLMTLVTLLSNARLPGLKLVTLGLLLNFAVIAANFGQMPGAPDKLAAAGYIGPPATQWSNFTVMNENTRFWFLGDNILVGSPWPHPSVISLGDVLIIVGVFWFFQRVMKTHPLARRAQAPGAPPPA